MYPNNLTLNPIHVFKTTFALMVHSSVFGKLPACMGMTK